MFGFTSSMLNCAGVEKGNSHQNVLLVWRTDAECQCWEFEPTIRLGVARKHGWIRLYINPNRDTSVQPSIFAKMGWLAKCSQSAALRPGAGCVRALKNPSERCQELGMPTIYVSGKTVFFDDAFYFWTHLVHDRIDFTQHQPYQPPLTGVSFSNKMKKYQMQIHQAIQKRIVSLPMPAFFELDAKTCLGTPTRSCFCFWGSMFLSLFRFSWKHSHG